jgi:hypothetical protein
MEPTISQPTLAAPAKPAAQPASLSQFSHLEFRRKFWKVFGAEISIFDPASETMVGFIKMKAWKLREDIRLYTDKSMQTEVIRIKARQIIDFGATYDVFDSETNQMIGSLQRKGLRSAFVRDYWKVLDATGNVTGAVQETSSTLALARRWLAAISDLFDLLFMFVAQTYTISDTKSGTSVPAASLVHRRNPFLVRMALDVSDNQAKMDSRLLIAATALLSIMDAVKNS